ncbi:Pif-5 [Phenacoccus solenopsis nudivirus]|nr:Pif-5 [Phenacoccus solenopsis nudivirus]
MSRLLNVSESVLVRDYTTSLASRPSDRIRKKNITNEDDDVVDRGDVIVVSAEVHRNDDGSYSAPRPPISNEVNDVLVNDDPQLVRDPSFVNKLERLIDDTGIMEKTGLDSYTINKRIDEILQNEKRYRERLASEATRNTRAVGGSAFKIFVQSLRKLGKVAGKLADLTDLLKTKKVNVDIADNLLSTAKTSQDSATKILKINDVYVHSVDNLLRKGDLSKLVSDLKPPGSVVPPIPKSQTKAFAELASEFPESTLRNIDELSKLGSKQRPDFNTTIENIGKLPKSSVDKLDKIIETVKKLRPSLKSVVAIGVIGLGAYWYKTALEERKGCWLVKKINGETVSCKLTYLSCAASTGNACTDKYVPVLNSAMIMLKVLKSSDATLRKAFADKLGTTVETLNKPDEMKKLYTQKYEEIRNFKHASLTFNTSEYCSLSHPVIEEGVVPKCRMCDPTANPFSSTFADISDISDNITLHCVENPKLSDVIGDMSHTLGENLFRIGEGFLSPFIKVGLLVLVIVIIAAIIIFAAKLIITKAFSKRKDTDDYETNIMYEPLIEQPSPTAV